MLIELLILRVIVVGEYSKVFSANVSYFSDSDPISLETFCKRVSSYYIRSKQPVAHCYLKPDNELATKLYWMLT